VPSQETATPVEADLDNSLAEEAPYEGLDQAALTIKMRAELLPPPGLIEALRESRGVARATVASAGYRLLRTQKQAARGEDRGLTRAGQVNRAGVRLTSSGPLFWPGRAAVGLTSKPR
jgi:hypothetical protein